MPMMTKEEEGRVDKNRGVDVSVNVHFGEENAQLVDIQQIRIMSNIRVLEYMTLAELLIDDDYLVFSTDSKAKPFNGVFEAQISGMIDLRPVNTDDVLLRLDISSAPAFLNVTFSDTSKEYKLL